MRINSAPWSTLMLCQEWGTASIGPPVCTLTADWPASKHRIRPEARNWRGGDQASRLRRAAHAPPAEPSATPPRRSTSVAARAGSVRSEEPSQDGERSEKQTVPPTKRDILTLRTSRAILRSSRARKPTMRRHQGAEDGAQRIGAGAPPEAGCSLGPVRARRCPHPRIALQKARRGGDGRVFCGERSAGSSSAFRALPAQLETGLWTAPADRGRPPSPALTPATCFSHRYTL
jgi:hypothetical protein